MLGLQAGSCSKGLAWVMHGGHVWPSQQLMSPFNSSHGRAEDCRGGKGLMQEEQ